MMKAVADFAVLFHRQSTPLDVTDDNAARPWNQSYAAHLLTSCYCICYV